MWYQYNATRRLSRKEWLIRLLGVSTLVCFDASSCVSAGHSGALYANKSNSAQAETKDHPPVSALFFVCDPTIPRNLPCFG